MAGFRWWMGEGGDGDSAARDRVGDVEEKDEGVKGFWVVKVWVLLGRSDE